MLVGNRGREKNTRASIGAGTELTEHLSKKSRAYWVSGWAWSAGCEGRGRQDPQPNMDPEMCPLAKDTSLSGTLFGVPCCWGRETQVEGLGSALKQTVKDIDEQDLEQLFHMIDIDQSGTIEAP